MRRLGFLLLCGLLASAAAALLTHLAGTWPGPHPRAVDSLPATIDPDVDWRGERFRSDATPATTLAAVTDQARRAGVKLSVDVRSIESAMGGFSKAVYLVRQPFNTPLPLAERPLGDVLDEAATALDLPPELDWRLVVLEFELAVQLVDGRVAPPSIDLTFATISADQLAPIFARRWGVDHWSWYYFSDNGEAVEELDSFAATIDQAILLHAYYRLQANDPALEGEAGGLPPIVGLGMRGGGGNLTLGGLRIMASRRSVAEAEDALWRWGVEGLLIDLAAAFLIGMTGGLILLASRAIWRWRRTRRWRRAGRCGGCGYDLRGAADRCPECGREAASETSAAAAA